MDRSGKHYPQTIISASFFSNRGSHSHLSLHLLQLDVREYWKPGGHKPVDQPLVDRILSAVRSALVMNTSTESPISQVKMLDRKGDFLSGPSEVTVEMNDFFGPRITAQSRECSRMIFKVVRDLIGSTDNDHCDE